MKIASILNEKQQGQLWSAEIKYNAKEDLDALINFASSHATLSFLTTSEISQAQTILVSNLDEAQYLALLAAIIFQEISQGFEQEISEKLSLSEFDQVAIYGKMLFGFQNQLKNHQVFLKSMLPANPLDTNRLAEILHHLAGEIFVDSFFKLIPTITEQMARGIVVWHYHSDRNSLADYEQNKVKNIQQILIKEFEQRFTSNPDLALQFNNDAIWLKHRVYLATRGQKLNDYANAIHKAFDNWEVDIKKARISTDIIYNLFDKVQPRAQKVLLLDVTFEIIIKDEINLNDYDAKQLAALKQLITNMHPENDYEDTQKLLKSIIETWLQNINNKKLIAAKFGKVDAFIIDKLVAIAQINNLFFKENLLDQLVPTITTWKENKDNQQFEQQAKRIIETWQDEITLYDHQQFLTNMQQDRTIVTRLKNGESKIDPDWLEAIEVQQLLQFRLEAIKASTEIWPPLLINHVKSFLRDAHHKGTLAKAPQTILAPFNIAQAHWVLLVIHKNFTHPDQPIIGLINSEARHYRHDPAYEIKAKTYDDLEKTFKSTVNEVLPKANLFNMVYTGQQIEDSYTCGDFVALNGEMAAKFFAASNSTVPQAEKFPKVNAKQLRLEDARALVKSESSLGIEVAKHMERDDKGAVKRNIKAEKKEHLANTEREFNSILQNKISVIDTHLISVKTTLSKPPAQIKDLQTTIKEIEKFIPRNEQFIDEQYQIIESRLSDIVNQTPQNLKSEIQAIAIGTITSIQQARENYRKKLLEIELLLKKLRALVKTLASIDAVTTQVNALYEEINNAYPTASTLKSVNNALDPLRETLKNYDQLESDINNLFTTFNSRSTEKKAKLAHQKTILEKAYKDLQSLHGTSKFVLKIYGELIQTNAKLSQNEQELEQLLTIAKTATVESFDKDNAHVNKKLAELFSNKSFPYQTLINNYKRFIQELPKKQTPKNYDLFHHVIFELNIAVSNLESQQQRATQISDIFKQLSIAKDQLKLCKAATIIPPVSTLTPPQPVPIPEENIPNYADKVRDFFPSKVISKAPQALFNHKQRITADLILEIKDEINETKPYTHRSYSGFDFINTGKALKATATPAENQPDAEYAKCVVSLSFDMVSQAFAQGWNTLKITGSNPVMIEAAYHFALKLGFEKEKITILNNDIAINMDKPSPVIEEMLHVDIYKNIEALKEHFHSGTSKPPTITI